jgi:hypothetical protein
MMGLEMAHNILVADYLKMDLQLDIKLQALVFHQVL